MNERFADVVLLTAVWSVSWFAITVGACIMAGSVWLGLAMLGGWGCSLALAGFAEYLLTRWSDMR